MINLLYDDKYAVGISGHFIQNQVDECYADRNAKKVNMKEFEERRK